MVVSLTGASASYAGHDAQCRLSRVRRTAQPPPAVRATPARAVHPSRSKKAQVKSVPRREKLDVMTKLAMWGVDVDRMRGEGRASLRVEDTNTPPSSSSSSSDQVKERVAAPTDAVGVSDDLPSAAAAVSTSTDEKNETEPSSASARLASLLSRQRAERWPTVGTESWAYARTRIVSASEASAALGIDRFRTPERLIADKLARLDAAEGLDAETLTAIAALNPSFDPDAGQAALGWRARGGKGVKRPKRQKSKAAKGGVGGGLPASAKPSVKFQPPAVVHGNEFEPVARAHYARVETCEVHEFGLKIHDQLSWLGATPDGVVAVTRDGGDSLVLLEIKCPYSRPVLPRSRAQEHFPQIQVALQVFGADACHFVQYKPPGIGRGRAGVMNEDRPLYLRETIRKDEGWWNANRPKLERFHEKLARALAARDERVAAAGWRGVGDGGEIDDWEEEVSANF